MPPSRTPSSATYASRRSRSPFTTCGTRSEPAWRRQASRCSRLQEWMGHADLKTTLRYMHYAPRADDAARLSAFIAAQTEPNVVPLDAAAAA
jgi:integrase